MQRRQVVFSRIVLIVLVISIIGLLIVALLGVNKNMSPEDAIAPETAKEEKPLLLTNIPEERVEIAVRGPIVADENFRGYTISVSQKERTMSVYNGYKKDAGPSAKLYNNSESFTQFVYALERAKMASEVAKVSDDTRGVCASGELVTFNIYHKNELKKSLWTSTCGGSKGNLAGDAAKLQKLFSSQIPEYSVLLDRAK